MKIRVLLIILILSSFNVQFIFSQGINFFAKTDFTTGGNPRVAAIGDINSDGRPDIVTANYGSNTISVLLSTTPPTSIPSFSSKVDFATGPHPASVAVADLNGDGKPDIVVVSVDDSTVSVFVNTTSQGASTPSFVKNNFHTGAAPVSVVVADINGDGKPDIITSNFTANTVSVLLNSTPTSATTATFSKKDFNTDNGPYFVTIGDVNGDGKPDIITANNNKVDSTVSVLINTTATGVSTPSFSAKTDIRVSIKPISVALSDLSGSGKPDILVVGNADTTLAILLNTTSPNSFVPEFSTGPSFTIGGNSFYVTSGDLNNDGKPDVVIANIFASTISVFMNTTLSNNSAITFSPRLDFKTGTNPAAVVIADINNDGKPDLITANYMGGSVSVLYDSSTHSPVSLFDELAAMYIQNSANQNVLSVQSIDYGTKVSLGTESEEYENEWFVVQDGSYPSYYRLKNLYSSKVMSDSSDGSMVVKGEASDDNQRWRLDSVGTNEWEIENVKTGKYLTLNNNVLSLAALDSSASQKWYIKMVNPNYAVPEPKPLNTGSYMIGAEMCNLWDVTTRPYCWNNIAPYPDRKPVTGWFKEGSPEVMDWDIKMAADNGISFFSLCWYRTEASVGNSNVTGVYDQWINGLANAKYKNYTKFMLIWCNTSLTGLYGGISNENDFLNNLAPYFINHYFKNPNYLLIDNKPVISFYDAPAFINECGGVSNAADAITKFRQMVVNAGFSGLILMGQWCSGDYITHSNSDWQSIGAEYSNAYHWPTFAYGAIPQWPLNTYYPDSIDIASQQYCWKGQAQYSVLPNLVTCTMGWDNSPWGGGKTHGFRLTPNSFANLIDSAKSFIDQRNQSNLESHFIALDNWDEFGEGHYIYPTEQYGFGYLRSVKQTFGTITSVKEKNNQLPTDFSLSQNYPNPFNPSTEIKYSIPKSGSVTLKVYDILGQEVTTLVNQEQKQGSYSVNFNASKLASGIYMYKLQSGDFSVTKKMMLLK